MKTILIAALAAAQLAIAARPAQAAEVPREGAAFQPERLAEGVELNLEDKRVPALGAGAAPAPLHSAAARDQEEEPRKKKRKSTGDKVLTGAAVVLGIGALAVGGLLVAIFVG